jgi:hypothetical protein
LPRRTWLLAPACGVLVALCTVLAAWHTTSRPAPSGFDLRADPASPNFDSNSATATGADPAPPRQPPTREDGEPRITIGPLSRPPSEPPANDLPPLPPAPPGPPETRRDSPRGDDTMTQVKILGLPIALAAALSAPPMARAGDVEKTPTPEQMARDIKDIKEEQKKSSEALMGQLKAIQDQLRSVEGLRKDVDGLKNTVQSINVALELTTQNLRAKTTELAEAQAALKQMREDLDRVRAAGTARCDGLTEQVADLKRRLDDTSRQAARMTEATGTVRLFNTFNRAVSIVVNGRSYQLEPGESHTLANQPLGTVTFEALGVGPRTTRMLTADRPLDIEVYDLARGPIKTPR